MNTVCIRTYTYIHRKRKRKLKNYGKWASSSIIPFSRSIFLAFLLSWGLSLPECLTQACFSVLTEGMRHWREGERKEVWGPSFAKNAYQSQFLYPPSFLWHSPLALVAFFSPWVLIFLPQGFAPLSRALKGCWTPLDYQREISQFQPISVIVSLLADGRWLW